jgi:hypothetical protein
MELGDVWWHLSTGQWIMDNGALPESDPFTTASDTERDNSFVLKGFWLSQISFSIIESFSGLKGLIAFKALLFALSAFFLWLGARLQGASGFVSALCLIPALIIFSFYDETRPQTFTILLTAITLYLLEHTRKQGSCFRLSDTGKNIPTRENLYFLLIPLMLIWANLHPGFIVGIALISLYAIEHLTCTLVLKRSGVNRPFLIACAVAVAVSALNPNGLESMLRTFYMLKQSALGSATIHEHLGVAKFVEMTGMNTLMTVFISVGSIGISTFALSRKRLDLLHLFMFISLAGLSIVTFRAGIFFALFSVIALAYNLADNKFLNKLTWSNLSQKKSKYAQYVLIILLVVSCAFILNMRSYFSRGIMSPGIFPEKAASFIMRSNAPANIYHPYEWGGYLIWRLYPKYKMFIDGRALMPVAKHLNIQNAGPGWRASLESHNISTVTFWPLLPYRKRVPPIIFALAKDKAWRAVYWDTRSLVFVKAAYAVNPLKRYAVWDLLESLARQGAVLNPSDAVSYIALGEIYIHRKLPTFALAEFRKALLIDPGNTEAAKWVDLIGNTGPIKY